MATRSKRKNLAKANRLLSQLQRSVEARDCATSVKLVERASAAVERAANKVAHGRLTSIPAYGRLLRLQAQFQVSCKRTPRWKL